MSGEENGGSINFKIATLVGMLVIIIQGAYWIGTLAERVNSLETGTVSATRDRWTKSQDDTRHEAVQQQLVHIQRDLDEIKQMLKTQWIRP